MESLGGRFRIGELPGWRRSLPILFRGDTQLEWRGVRPLTHSPVATRDTVILCSPSQRDDARPLIFAIVGEGVAVTAPDEVTLVLVWQTVEEVRLRAAALLDIRPLGLQDAVASVDAILRTDSPPGTAVEPRLVLGEGPLEEVAAASHGRTGKRALLFPPLLRRLAEVLVVRRDEASDVLISIRPGDGVVELLPQDWLSNLGLDPGYQYIDAVWRDPGTGHICGRILRYGEFSLDDSGLRLREMRRY